MAYAICRVKNISGGVITLCGKELAIDELYTIEDLDRIRWGTDDQVMAAIVGEDLHVYDANGVIEGSAQQIAHLQKY